MKTEVFLTPVAYNVIICALQELNSKVDGLSELKPKEEEETYGMPDPVPAQLAYKKLNISNVSGWKWEKLGKLVPFRIGKRKYYHRDEILKLLNQ